MSGELRIVRGALGWGSLGMVVAAAILIPLRGVDAGVSVAIAAGLVLANAGISAVISAGAGRVSKTGSMMIAMPSFAIRMAMIASTLIFLKGKSFIDEPVFALAFGTTILAVIVLEARAWKRTPWLVLAFETEGS